MLEKDYYKKVEVKGYLKFVLYSDSVSKDSKITIYINNIPYTTTFNNFWEYLININHKVTIINDKEYIFIQNNNIKMESYDIISDSVVKKTPKYIMRHLINDKLCKINVGKNQSIEVTYNHSLLTYDNESKTLNKIKPKECNYLSVYNNQNPLINDELDILYFLIGLYIGDGSLAVGNKNKHQYPGLSLENRTEMKLFITNMDPSIKFYDKTNKWDCYINYPKLRNLLITEGYLGVKSIYRTISDNLFNEMKLNSKKFISFITGFWLSDGSYINNIICFNSGSSILLIQLQYLFHYYNIYTIFSESKNGRKYKGKINGSMYRLKLFSDNNSIIKILKTVEMFKQCKSIKYNKGTYFGNGTSKKNPNITRKYKLANIKSIRPCRIIEHNPIKYNDFVYDVEIDDYHNFFIDGVLVHNTDSIFIAIPKQWSDNLPILQTDIQPILEKYKIEFIKNQEKEKEKNPNYNIREWSTVKDSFIKWITVEKVADKINNLIINYTQNTLLKRCNIDPKHNKTFFKSELLMDNILSLNVKKNYAYKLIVKEGVVLDIPKINYTGIQVIKSDATKLTQKMLKTMIEDIALNDKIPNQDKNTKSTQIINYYENEMKKDIKSLIFDNIGVPVKWGKAETPINGMKIYNFIMNQDVFSPGVAGRSVYCKFLKPSIFDDVKKHLKSEIICIPYSYDPDILKQKLQEFYIEIDSKKQWERIFTKTCERVELMIRQFNSII